MINENTWAISDTHFEHINLIEKYEPIRLETYKREGYDNYDDFQVDKWNAKIKPGDTVFHLGDFTINRHNHNKTIDTIERYDKILNGNIILLKGNHDIEDEVYENLGWTVIKEPKICDKFPYVILELCGKKILFCHLALIDESLPENHTNKYRSKYSRYYDEIKQVFDNFKCDVIIHGHSHSFKQPDKRCINVSVECTDFSPTRLGEIIKNI